MSHSRVIMSYQLVRCCTQIIVNDVTGFHYWKLQAPRAFETALAAAEHATTAACSLPGIRVLGGTGSDVSSGGAPPLIDPLKLTIDVRELGLSGRFLTVSLLSFCLK